MLSPLSTSLWLSFGTQIKVVLICPLHVIAFLPINLETWLPLRLNAPLETKSWSVSDYLTPSHWQSYKAIKNRKLPESIPIAASPFSPWATDVLWIMSKPMIQHLRSLLCKVGTTQMAFGTALSDLGKASDSLDLGTCCFSWANRHRCHRII